MNLCTPKKLRKYSKSGFTYNKAFRNKNRASNYKFGVMPLDTNWGPGLVNTDFDLGSVKKIGAQVWYILIGDQGRQTQIGGQDW